MRSDLSHVLYNHHIHRLDQLSFCRKQLQSHNHIFPCSPLCTFAIHFDQTGHRQESLYSILKAYTIRHADKGYCQGQAPLAAVLLMFMPEVDAFWTFNEVCERYLEAYYDDGLVSRDLLMDAMFVSSSMDISLRAQWLTTHGQAPQLIFNIRPQPILGWIENCLEKHGVIITPLLRMSSHQRRQHLGFSAWDHQFGRTCSRLLTVYGVSND